MGFNKETFRGGYKLEQIRRIKQRLMIVQLVLVFVAAIFLTVVDGSVQLKPFYFNIGSFLYFVILMGLVAGVESFVFRMLELKYTKSTSSKYFILKTVQRRSIVVIAFAAVVMVLLLTPFLADAIANYSGESGTTAAGTANFYNRDRFGLTTVEKVHVETNVPAVALVVSEANYFAYLGDIAKLKQFSVVSADDASGGVDLAFPQTGFGIYYIVVSAAEGSVEATYTVHKALAPTFVGFVTLFSVLFIGFYAAWIAYTVPIKKKYAKGAIYR